MNTDPKISICDFGPPPKAPQNFNLAQYVLQHAEDLRDKTAITIARSADDFEGLSYRQIAKAVRQTAGGLHAQGIKPGERVLLRIGNSMDFPISFLASISLGAVAVPTSSTLSARELSQIAGDTDARLLIHSPELAMDDLKIPQIEPQALMGSELDAFAPTKADDLAYIIYTSGSSGRPKGVAHAHRAAYARRMMWQGWYGMSADDVMLHAGAFNWSYTLGAGLLDPWAMGASSVIYAGEKNPGIWTDLIIKTRATIFAAVPGVYRQWLNSAARLDDLNTLRHGLSAGEAMNDAVRERFAAETGRPIFEALGMSECSTYLSTSPATPYRAGFMGRPQKGRKIALLPIDEGEVPVPLGEVGVIAIDRDDPGLMLGYWQDEAATQAAMRGGWFLTGDLASMNADGYLRYEGRADDQMNALGYRVAPQEVEAALMRHSLIEAAAAVELPLVGGKSVIAAFLVSQAGALDEADVRSHCAGELADYKIPKIFRTLDELPRNPNGKLNRKALIARFREDGG